MAPRAADRAVRATIGEAATRAHLEVMAAGRDVIARTSPRWRRVTDGQPCGFCAMLASRGPVYGSAQKAGAGNAYHGRCGCTVEPYDGDPMEWEPTPDEQRFIDAYEAVHEPGMSGAETAAKIEEWLADPANALADDALELTIDGLDEDAFDALITAKMNAGDYDAVDRLSELWETRRAATTPPPWRPDPLNPMDDETFAWFSKLDDDAQVAFTDDMPAMYRETFQQHQWAWENERDVPVRGRVPTEREIRAAWEDWLDLEVLRLQAVADVAVTNRAWADGRRTRDLYRGYNETTVKAWANEDTKRYWQVHGRMTYETFRAGMLGDAETSAKSKWGVAF